MAPSIGDTPQREAPRHFIRICVEPSSGKRRAAAHCLGSGGLARRAGRKSLVPTAILLSMTEMLAALLGAIVGGVISAWVGARQTANVLKHETDLAAAERREAQRAEEERRRSFAADQLIAALADFVTVRGEVQDPSASFARGIPVTADVRLERDRRAATLLQAGSSHAHALPTEVRERWSALTWLVRFNQSEQPGRSEGLRRRDAADLLNYSEYVRQSLCAVCDGSSMPSQFPAPDVRRDDRRVWGFRPVDRSKEPDLTDWHMAARWVGKVKFSSGEERWYGPGGLVKDLSQEPSEEDLPAV